MMAKGFKETHQDDLLIENVICSSNKVIVSFFALGASRAGQHRESIGARRCSEPVTKTPLCKLERTQIPQRRYRRSEPIQRY